MIGIIRNPFELVGMPSESSKGFCHLRALKMIEIWVDIEGYEDSYQVSNLGRVKSKERLVFDRLGKLNNLRKEKKLKNKLNKYGYNYVGLYKRGFCNNKFVHRLVANAFILNVNNLPQVNHINGIKTDNKVQNLEWVTASQNRQHSFDIGLSPKGDDHYTRKRKLCQISKKR